MRRWLGSRAFWDTLPAVGLFLVALLPLVAPENEVGIGRPVPPTHGPGLLYALVITAQTLPMAVRHRFPGPVLAVVACGYATSVACGLPAGAADLTLPWAAFVLFRHGSARHLAVFGPVAVAPLVAAVSSPPFRAAMTWGGTAAYAAIVIVAPMAVGVLTRRASPPRPDAAPPHPARPADAPRVTTGPVTPPRAAAGSGSTGGRRVETGLTVREREVLARLRLGMSNAEIATDLGVSTETVKTHVSRIIRKLGVRDRTAAAVRAHRDGLAD